MWSVPELVLTSRITATHVTVEEELLRVSATERGLLFRNATVSRQQKGFLCTKTFLSDFHEICWIQRQKFNQNEKDY